MHNLFLFDVDGTLAPSGGQIPAKNLALLNQVKEQGHDLALVSGGTYDKLITQIGGKANEALFEWIFAENGTAVYRRGLLVEKLDLRQKYTSVHLDKVVDHIQTCIFELDVPFRRGSFVKFRTGMIYVTPVGADLTPLERLTFAQYDLEKHTRHHLIAQLLPRLAPLGFTVKFGGQVGVAVHPQDWNKARVLKYIEGYDSILFYGDRCDVNGNDYPLFSRPEVTGYPVEDPTHTGELLELSLLG